MENILGTKLADRYLIEELVGVGGMCNVYRAFDAEALQTVAVKMLRDEYAADEEYLRRFRNESRAINALSHPNIVKIYDVVLDAPNPYLVMEYVSGITLKEYIDRKKPLPGRTAANIAGLVLTALQCAHENGIVHRDVKPQNIMVTEKGEVKVMDFGIARFAMSQSHTIDGNAIGSVHYISPEQALGGAVDQRTDIYSVGVILFEMLCGRLPFDGESPVSVALQQVEQNPKALRSLNPNVPVGLEQITLHAMAKNPDDRYADCGEMIADLRRWLADPKTTFPAYTATPVKKAAEFVRNKVPKKTGADAPKPAGGRKKLKDRLTTPLSRLFAVTCGVVVASVLFVFVMFQIYQPFQKVEDITLPNLVGVDYTAATAGSAYPDIRIELESEDFNTEYEAGQIYRQSPSAGKSVKKGSTVQVWVSAGGQMIPIPTFTNQEATAVYAKLVSLGLKYSTTEIASDTIAEGSVVRTSPEAGQSAPAGSTVVVYVSTGSNKERVQVPEVLGYPEEVAVQTLKDAQFEVAVTYQVSDYQYDGLVMSQSPASPSMVPIGSKVTIVVGTVDESAAVGEATVTLQTIPPDLPGTVTVTAVLNGTTVYSDTIEPQNTRLISIPLQGTGTCMVDVLIDGMVYKSASVDFDAGQYYWTADYSGSFGE
ncbi:MAG: Stk1 family PASTA domain-containing Ser/Thr kinase [Angelakisella sp.]|nr:Stk1 family PASTA domain-containing Ser/Thr kinase [Angelakisella sp.]